MDASLTEKIESKGSRAWWADQISGQPSTLHETVMSLLDSGFTPMNCYILLEKLKQVVLDTVKKYMHRSRLEVPMSCTAWIIPGEVLPSMFFFC
jgi:RNA-dependent RNA polymerase